MFHYMFFFQQKLLYILAPPKPLWSGPSELWERPPSTISNLRLKYYRDKDTSASKCQEVCHYVTELVDWTRAGVLAPAEAPCPGQGGSFSARMSAANKETNAETGTAQAFLFNGQRTEKLVRKSTSQANSGRDSIYKTGSK